MKTDKKFELMYGEDGKKISELVRKYHFYTAWKKYNKEDVLLVAKKVVNSFNQWKAKKCGIRDAFKWNGYFWEQLDGRYELIQPNHTRWEKDFHLMYCFHRNYKKAREEFIRLIYGDY